MAVDNTELGNDWFDFRSHILGFLTTLLLGLIASLPIIRLIFQHLANFNEPTHQRQVIRLLFVIPAFATYCLLAYRFPALSGFFASIRDLYEAFAIFSVFNLFLAYRPISNSLAEVNSKEADFAPALAPALPTEGTSKKFSYKTLSIFVWQYIVIRFILTTIEIVTEALGLQDPSSGLIIPGLNFVFVCVAVVAVILAEKQIRAELVASSSPLLKIIGKHGMFMQFMAVKVVVLLITVQTAIVNTLVAKGIIHNTITWTASNAASSLETVLLALELIPLAFLHLISYRVAPYRKASQTSIWASFLQAINIYDLFRSIVQSVTRGDAPSDDLYSLKN